MKTKTDVCITDYELLDWEEMFEFGEFSYCIMGNEICPDTSRPHIQGFIQFKNDMTWKKIKDLPFWSTKTHVEWRKKTVQNNIDYCKKDGDWKEWGTPCMGHQGMRSDLDEITEEIKKGKSLLEISFNFPAQWIRYSNGIKSLYSNWIILNGPEWRDITTTIYVGESGAGKTRKVPKKDTFIVNMENKSEFIFDGYLGQKTILIDDFYGQIKYHYMLRILDGYELPLNIKNGKMIALWENVFITSNVTPTLWYSSGLRSLKRRINNLYEVREGNTIPLSLETKKSYEIESSDEESSDT